MAREVRPVYTAVNEADAKARLDEFYDSWADRYPAIKILWENAWGEFVPFLDSSVAVRRAIYSMDEILNHQRCAYGVASERPPPRRRVPVLRRSPSPHRRPPFPENL